MAYEYLYCKIKKNLSDIEKKELKDILNDDSNMYRIKKSLDRLKKNYGYGVKDS
jgi:hypothetical protein